MRVLKLFIVVDQVRWLVVESWDCFRVPCSHHEVVLSVVGCVGVPGSSLLSVRGSHPTAHGRGLAAVPLCRLGCCPTESGSAPQLGGLRSSGGREWVPAEAVKAPRVSDSPLALPVGHKNSSPRLVLHLQWVSARESLQLGTDLQS